MRPMVTVLAAIVLPALSTGCVFTQTSDGSDLFREQVDRLVPGESSRSDVTNYLGPPDEIVYSNREHDPLFERAFVYKRSIKRQTALFLLIFSTFRSDTKYDLVTVFFDDAGQVLHIGTRLDADEAEYGMPW